VEGFLEGLAGKGILTPREAAEVDPGRISAFFRSRTGKRILAAPQVYREASFVMKTSFRGAPRLVQGTIDCCFMEGDRWVLVDYKSNYIDPNIWEEEKERMSLAYQTQMRLYKEALEKITKTPVREAILYLLAAGDQLTMTY
jgi:ATP-dependent helicase/nuclease subunit A